MDINNQKLELQCQVSSKVEALTIDLSESHSRLMREFIATLYTLCNQPSYFTDIKPGDTRVFFNRIKLTKEYQRDIFTKEKFKPYTSGTQPKTPHFFTELKHRNMHEKCVTERLRAAQLIADSALF